MYHPLLKKSLLCVHNVSLLFPSIGYFCQSCFVVLYCMYIHPTAPRSPVHGFMTIMIMVSAGNETGYVTRAIDLHDQS